MIKIRCRNCKVYFSTHVALKQHRCPVIDEDMTTKELLRRYQDQQKAA